MFWEKGSTCDGRRLPHIVNFDQNAPRVGLKLSHLQQWMRNDSHINTTAASDIEAVCKVYISSAQRQS